MASSAFLSRLEEAFPSLSEDPAWDRGLPFVAAGHFALLLREWIERPGGAESAEVDRAIRILNALAVGADAEMLNLLTVGVFEVLSDSDAAVQIAMQRLDGPALEAFKQILEFWYRPRR